MMIAQMAYYQLNGTNPGILNDVFQQIGYYKSFYPSLSDPLSAAVWADKIKEMGLEYFSTWHYIDTPWNPEHITVPPISNINVVWSLGQIGTAYQNHLNPDWGNGFSIRFLLHLVGDIHQPLHNINYYSHKYPSGDDGGNLFKVVVNGTVTELHKLWDSGCGLYMTNYTYPLTNSSIQEIMDKSYQLLNSYPVFVVNNTNYQEWSDESYDLAVKYGYSGVLKNNTVSYQYLKNGQRICQQQMVKASYRLAYLIQKLFTF